MLINTRHYEIDTHRYYGYWLNHDENKEYDTGLMSFNADGVLTDHESEMPLEVEQALIKAHMFYGDSIESDIELVINNNGSV
jgi:hypothetical protein